MAKSDWRGPFYAGQETPLYFARWGWYQRGLAGTSSPWCLNLLCDEWRYTSWFGYTYDGVDASSFPMDDGSMSAALRTGDNSFGHQGSRPFGLFMRLQSLPSLDASSPTPHTSMNLYAAGLNYTSGGTYTCSVTHNNPQAAVYRILNGGYTLMGNYFYPRVILDPGDSRFVQIEFRLQNSGGNVVIDTRWNESAESCLRIVGVAGATTLTTSIKFAYARG
jgi:hypothetical protein